MFYSLNGGYTFTERGIIDFFIDIHKNSWKNNNSNYRLMFTIRFLMFQVLYHTIAFSIYHCEGGEIMQRYSPLWSFFFSNSCQG